MFRNEMHSDVNTNTSYQKWDITNDLKLSIRQPTKTNAIIQTTGGLMNLFLVTIMRMRITMKIGRKRVTVTKNLYDTLLSSTVK